MEPIVFIVLLIVGIPVSVVALVALFIGAAAVVRRLLPCRGALTPPASSTTLAKPVSRPSATAA
mgnify:CR=1 FL=1